MEEKAGKDFMNTGSEHILVEKRKEVGIITLKKSDGLNILDSTMLHDLGDFLNELEKDETIRVLIITGVKNFSAGANIKEMKEFNPVEAKTFSDFGNRLFNQVENLEKPIIAAISGYAFGGGCELALACDIRISSADAKFGQPEVNLGLIPGFGATRRLPRLVGIGKAKEMILTGRTIDSKEAEAIGLVNKVVQEEELMEKSLEVANIIAQKGPVAVKLAKKLINENQEIKEGLEREIVSFSECFNTRDHREGINAFLEKRKPVFKGV
ncbi:MAG: enoyl-CoA hydratase-related protein [Candidatus Methanoperedens sp.]|nr:enoyl-CoA hydratase-related protein [Candidatus Methanoperedens sp.]CAG0952739.1 enoyl-CoA hydratase [Methanosarcinales archaeon]